MKNFCYLVTLINVMGTLESQSFTMPAEKNALYGYIYLLPVRLVRVLQIAYFYNINNTCTCIYVHVHLCKTLNYSNISLYNTCTCTCTL